MPLAFPDVKGWLTKRAMSGKNSWKRRWFVLDDRGRFKYYANDAVERNPKGVVEKGMIQITHETKFRDTIVAGQRVLELVAAGATLVAYPDDVRYIGQWVDELETAACMLKPGWSVKQGVMTTRMRLEREMAAGEGGGDGEGGGEEGGGEKTGKKKSKKGKAKKGGGEEEEEAKGGDDVAAASAAAAVDADASTSKSPKTAAAKGKKGAAGAKAAAGDGGATATAAVAAAAAPAPPAAGGDAKASAPAPAPIGFLRAVVNEESKLCTFGACEKGQCGIGRYESGGVSAPEKLAALSGANAPVLVACGGMHMACITASGALFTWGDGTSGQLGGGPRLMSSSRPWLVPKLRTAKVTVVACGAAHTIAAGEGGAVWAWGKSELGALGLGPDRKGAQEPVQLTEFAGAAAGDAVVRMFAGADVSGAVLQSGAAYTWGDLSNGRLGHGGDRGGAAGVYAPEPVAALAGVRVSAMAFGATFGLFLSPDAGLFAAGALGVAPGAFEAARAEMSVPTVVPAFAGCGTFSSVSAAAGYAAAVVDGRVYVWGQLPAQTGWLALLPAPVPVPLFDDVAPVEAVCGTDHIFVRSREGALHAWGGSEAGQLGLKLFGTLATPREVPPVAPEHYVAQVAAGNRISAFVCVPGSPPPPVAAVASLGSGGGGGAAGRPTVTPRDLGTTADAPLAVTPPASALVSPPVLPLASPAAPLPPPSMPAPMAPPPAPFFPAALPPPLLQSPAPLPPAAQAPLPPPSMLPPPLAPPAAPLPPPSMPAPMTPPPAPFPAAVPPPVLQPPAPLPPASPPAPLPPPSMLPPPAAPLPPPSMPAPMAPPPAPFPAAVPPPVLQPPAPLPPAAPPAPLPPPSMPFAAPPPPAPLPVAPMVDDDDAPPPPPDDDPDAPPLPAF